MWRAAGILDRWLIHLSSPYIVTLCPPASYIGAGANLEVRFERTILRTFLCSWRPSVWIVSLWENHFFFFHYEPHFISLWDFTGLGKKQDKRWKVSYIWNWSTVINFFLFFVIQSTCRFPTGMLNVFQILVNFSIITLEQFIVLFSK